MTQPKFAPIAAPDEVRPAYRVDTPRPWRPHRPGELVKATAGGKGLGTPGPDQGYALGLAERLRGRLVLTSGEHAEDALTAGVVLGLRRAASYGRAPILADVEVGLELLGFLSDAPAELIAHRRELVDGVTHDYWRQRLLAESAPLGSLRGSPGESAATGWRERLGV
ncbi:MAG TPA: hypothetical protein VNF07_13220 [Acidimicrobiales bacterium]|nr:hypothetical protein [Acidimicrobiales bacterium]